jgi:hypothetical protein
MGCCGRTARGRGTQQRIPKKGRNYFKVSMMFLAASASLRLKFHPFSTKFHIFPR